MLRNKRLDKVEKENQQFTTAIKLLIDGHGQINKLLALMLISEDKQKEEIGIEKIWNQDETVKFNPSIILRMDIHKPGQKDYSQDGNKALKEYQVWIYTTTGGGIHYGNYGTHKRAKEEVDLIDNLCKIDKTQTEEPKQ